MKSPAHTARLVGKARDPDASLQERHAAFSRLVERSQHVVFGLALSSLHDVEDAKDVAQDAFATAWHRLNQLRDASAFEPWLKAITMSECGRQRRARRRRFLAQALPQPDPIAGEPCGTEYQALVAAALETLPEGERHVTVLFYFFGYSQPQIARQLSLKPGTVGKRLHSARLRIRRGLPRSVRSEFVRLTPSEAFVARVARGLLDEYIGEYRFDRRPDRVVSIIREGNALVSRSAGQRHVLVSAAEEALLTTHYDGEGRFRRDRRGRITHFVYYEFGKRLGIARKVDGST